MKVRSSHASLFSFWVGRKLEVALDIFLNDRAGREDAPKFMSFGAVWQKVFWVGLPRGWRIKIRIWNLKKKKKVVQLQVAVQASVPGSTTEIRSAEINCSSSVPTVSRSHFKTPKKKEWKNYFSFAYICLLSSTVTHAWNREVFTLSLLYHFVFCHTQAPMRFRQVFHQLGYIRRPKSWYVTSFS